jgi:hypothetical protein
MFHGKGVWVGRSGEIYRGDFRAGKKEGHGTLITPNKGRFEGEWTNDRRNGPGTFTNSAGDTFEGLYVDDKREGRGTYTWAGGDKYVGAFHQSIILGKGVFTTSDGKSVDVSWDYDKVRGLPSRSRHRIVTEPANALCAWISSTTASIATCCLSSRLPRSRPRPSRPRM